jgi:hypothetical protein
MGVVLADAQAYSPRNGVGLRAEMVSLEAPRRPSFATNDLGGVRYRFGANVYSAGSLSEV